jgi:hypothetical protein
MAVIISPVFRKGNWGSGWLHASPKAHNYSKAKPGPKLSLLNFWPSAIVTLSCSLPSCIVASAVHPALGKAESRVILEKVHFSLWHLPHVGASASVSWNPVPLWLWLFYGVCTFLSVCMEKKNFIISTLVQRSIHMSFSSKLLVSDLSASFHLDPEKILWT